MLSQFGNQNWWPADTKEEVIIGAILTQNTSWKNVEKSILNLKEKGVCTFQGIKSLEVSYLANLIYSSGYYNQKAIRLKYIAQNVNLKKLANYSVLDLRNYLLSINGIGPETADSIILYAFEKSIFVIDLYTKRIFSRLGFLSITDSYEKFQQLFMKNLDNSTILFQEFHALILKFSKQYCMKKPKCERCLLNNQCEYYKEKK